MISEVFSNGQTIEVPLPDLLSVQVSAGKGRAGRATYLPRSEPPLSSFLKKTISRGRVETVTEASPYICLGVGSERADVRITRRGSDAYKLSRNQTKQRSES
jgi:hypothetical protein